MARATNPSLYRAMRHLRKGGLHRALHLPENESIPSERLEKARASKNGHVRQMAQMMNEDEK